MRNAGRPFILFYKKIIIDLFLFKKKITGARLKYLLFHRKMELKLLPFFFPSTAGQYSRGMNLLITLSKESGHNCIAAGFRETCT